jgi:dephospho-CoA kinase
MKPKSVKKSSEAWGLTGGIAAGKSTVAALFAARGVPVLDADESTRALSAPGGAAYAAIVARFGTADRARLRSLVFSSDAGAKRDLEAILHPAIAEESARFFAKNPRCIYEASLLIETGRYAELGGLIVLSATPETRLSRLLERRPALPRAEAEAILRAQSAQFTRESLDRVRETQTVIEWENHGAPAGLSLKVDEFIRDRGWNFTIR